MSMNDYEALKYIFSSFMRETSNTAEPGQHLPEVRLLCRLIDEAEKTGYIIACPDTRRKEAEEK